MHVQIKKKGLHTSTGSFFNMIHAPPFTKEEFTMMIPGYEVFKEWKNKTKCCNSKARQAYWQSTVTLMSYFLYLSISNRIETTTISGSRDKDNISIFLYYIGKFREMNQKFKRKKLLTKIL